MIPDLTPTKSSTESLEGKLKVIAAAVALITVLAFFIGSEVTIMRTEILRSDALTAVSKEAYLLAARFSGQFLAIVAVLVALVVMTVSPLLPSKSSKLSRSLEQHVTIPSALAAIFALLLSVFSDAWISNIPEIAARSLQNLAEVDLSSLLYKIIGAGLGMSLSIALGWWTYLRAPSNLRKVFLTVVIILVYVDLTFLAKASCVYDIGTQKFLVVNAPALIVSGIRVQEGLLLNSDSERLTIMLKSTQQATAEPVILYIARSEVKSMTVNCVAQIARFVKSASGQGVCPVK